MLQDSSKISVRILHLVEQKLRMYSASKFFKQQAKFLIADQGYALEQHITRLRIKNSLSKLAKKILGEKATHSVSNVNYKDCGRL